MTVDNQIEHRNI